MHVLSKITSVNANRYSNTFTLVKENKTMFMTVSFDLETFNEMSKWSISDWTNFVQANEMNFYDLIKE